MALRLAGGNLAVVAGVALSRSQRGTMTERPVPGGVTDIALGGRGNVVLRLARGDLPVVAIGALPGSRGVMFKRGG